MNSQNQRRTFLGQIAVAGAAPFIPMIQFQEPDLSWIEDYLETSGKNNHASDSHDASLVTDEAFWYRVKNMFTASPGLLNLNNGGVSPQPRVVQEAFEQYNRMSNEAPSYYMWRILDQGREPLRARLASIGGVSADEVAICRNSSEALETVIFGLRLNRGDQVVLSYLDYPNMINAWKQREHRDGIVLKWVDLDLPSMSNEDVVAAFAKQITPDVKVVHITQMINWNGHILPVRKIADIAHAVGAKVIVDGAHAFAHIQFTIPDLGADYFGTSLHKWLCAPFGTGLLYVKSAHIASLYPLLAADDPESSDIRKFEALGTRSFAIEQAIGQAIDFYMAIGPQLKQDRLQYLKTYWTKALMNIPRISIRTDIHPERSCALAVMDIEGIPPGELSDKLQHTYKIHTTPIMHHNVSGVRVTPHLYTVTDDLDRLIAAARELAG
jgi:selenocysteine lyase/cysteine desulfurase